MTPPQSNDPREWLNYADALRRQGNPASAEAYRRTLQLDPNLPEANNNLAAVLTTSGQIDAAIGLFRRAIMLRPDWAEAHTNLATALHVSGQVNQAISACRRAMEINPNLAAAQSNLLIFLACDPNCDAQTIFAEHRKWNERFAAPVRSEIPPHTNDRNPNRPLRIGYVSPDLRDHPVSFFMEGLLGSHDRNQVEPFCYVDMPAHDAVSQRLSRLVPQWHSISGQSDVRAANLIRQHQIDILIDLAGHTNRNRMQMFARKPAPIQMTYLGYQNTTGLDAIDYCITDAYLDPPGMTERYFSEKLLRMPETFACYTPPAITPPVSALPALAARVISFGSFVLLAKVNEQVIRLWSTILKQIPQSRLLMVAGGLHEPAIADRYRQAFVQNGIDPRRLTFAGIQPFAKYLELHQHIDLLLDPFPVSGHTITCHGLWMGVPTICLAGSTHFGRLSTSVMGNMNLGEFIATTTSRYVEIAVEQSRQLDKLARLRAGLRQRMSVSPLMDAGKFARNIESAYREIWRQWCIG